jgi:arylamine N-acetyltransferase
MVSPLPATLAQHVLAYLGVSAVRPDLTTLDDLVNAYTRTVPWESASRIARRAQMSNIEDCPRWPEEFWRTALEQGTGGTCYESNYAFFSLLRQLGYDGYLTINNMGDSIGCHAAIVILPNGERWLVDVGLPVYAPLPLQARAVTHRPHRLQNYTARPLEPAVYQIEREPHPRPVCFTLLDKPIPEAEYRRITANDYGPKGYFIDQIVINKVIDGRMWRFNSADSPYHLEVFENGARTDYPLAGTVPTAIARHFGIAPHIVSAAFSALKLPTHN